MLRSPCSCFALVEIKLPCVSFSTRQFELQGLAWGDPCRSFCSLFLNHLKLLPPFDKYKDLTLALSDSDVSMWSQSMLQLWEGAIAPT